MPPVPSMAARPKPPPYATRAVHGSESANVWLVGAHGMAARWDGTNVEMIRDGDANETLNLIWTNGKDDAWVSGTADGTPTTLHWDGATWSSRYALAPAAFWGTGKSDMWAAVNGFRTDALHWDGNDWSPTMAPNLGITELTALWGAAKDDLWVVAALGGIAHWDGKGWAMATSATGGINPFARQNWYLAVWGSGSSDVWAFSENITANAGPNGGMVDAGFAHWNGSTWTAEVHPGACANVMPATRGASRMWGTGQDRIYAVGTGCEWSYDGKAWTRIGAWNGPDTTDPALTHWGLPGGHAYAVRNDELIEVLGVQDGAWLSRAVFPNHEWRRVSVGSDDEVWSVTGSRDATKDSSLVRWNGSDWAPTSLPFVAGDVSVRSATDVWVAEGTTSLTNAATRVSHFDGKVWTDLPSLKSGEGGLQIRALAKDDAWSFGVPIVPGAAFLDSMPPTHWNGKAWSDIAIPYSYVAALYPVRADLAWFAGIEMTLNGTIYGPIVVYRWDGVKATEAYRRPAHRENLLVTGIWASDTADAVWMSGYPTFHWDGKTWNELEMTTYGVWGTGPSDVWLLRDTGAIEHWDGRDLVTVRGAGSLLSSIGGSAKSVWVAGARGGTLRLGAPP
jgi:hypothetical protein